MTTTPISRIARLRQRDGLSQKQLAALLGKTQQAVAKWELGTSRPRIEALFLMSSIFGASVDEIMDAAPALAA